MHDKIPATLIADSAAAALMKAGRVHAVIVGADRVAANGIRFILVSVMKLHKLTQKHKTYLQVTLPTRLERIALPYLLSIMVFCFLLLHL